jgi:transcriptional regulator with XRE-family HTH domain
MAGRRLELRLTQEQVAGHVHFAPKSGRRRNLETVLSRTAYCMYETDNVEPDLAKIEEIAKALAVSPGWLAFGEREPRQPPTDRDIVVTDHLTTGDGATQGEHGALTAEVPVVIIKLFSR